MMFSQFSITRTRKWAEQDQIMHVACVPAADESMGMLGGQAEQEAEVNARIRGSSDKWVLL